VARRGGPGPQRARDPGAGPARDRRTLELLALGAALLVLVALIARLPDWLSSLRAFQIRFAAAFALYALTLARLPRLAGARAAAAIVLAVALAARLALLGAQPSLSDDIYRYAWEGRVLLHGGDPWAQPPDDPALAALRDQRIYPGVNHPDLATIYPPLAEAGFALVAALSPTLAAMKLWVMAHDLVLIALLMMLLRRHGVDPTWAALYAWNPLVLIEYAGSGHNDPTAMVWLLAALLLARARPALSALALAAGVMVKLAPLAALPALWREWPGRARALAALALAAGLSAFAWLTRGASSGLHAYWSTWRNNDLVFELLERWTGGFEAARAIELTIVAAAIAFALWRGFEAARATRAVLKTGYLVSPVAHPWYAGWFLMLEPLAPSAPWILLSATAIMSYGVLGTPAAGRGFHLPLAWRAVEFGAPALLAVGLAVARPRGRAGGRS
jgi:hypothetical protein